MPRHTALEVTLTPEERRHIQQQLRKADLSHFLARRYRVIWLMAERVPITTIALRLAIARRHVYGITRRFLAHRLEGLTDQRGKQRHA